MKKLALAMIAASAMLFGFGAVASAQLGYTPSLTIGTPSPGGPFAATYTNCVNGETITFTQPQSTPASISVVCAGNSATANFTAAPTATGTFVITASGTISGVLTQSFSIAGTTPSTLPATGGTDGGAGGGPGPVVPPGTGLPATGSNGIGSVTTIALGLLTVGFGLFVVAQLRRRQPSLA